MKVFAYMFVSSLLCLTVMFSSCSNTSSKSSTEKSNVSPEAVAEKADISPVAIVITDKADVNPKHIALTEQMLLHFEQEQCDKIVLHFDDNVKSKIKESQLSGVWERLSTHYGKYSNSVFHNAEILNDRSKVVYECNFAMRKMYFQLVFDKDNKIADISFNPK